MPEQFTVEVMSENDYEDFIRLMDIVAREHHERDPELFKYDHMPMVSFGRWKELLKDQERTFLKAVTSDRQQCAGVIALRMVRPRNNPMVHNGPYTYMDELVVYEGFRRQGVARILCQAAKKWSQDQRAQELRLTVYERNQSAVDAYEKLGFRTKNREMTLQLKDEFAGDDA